MITVTEVDPPAEAPGVCPVEESEGVIAVFVAGRPAGALGADVLEITDTEPAESVNVRTIT